jgi:hypothetical protein
MERDLVPAEPGRTPGYWCTWGAQNYTMPDVELLNHSMIAANLTEEHMFGESGWATAAYEKVRPDLYILFDLGWDVPASTEFDEARWKLGSLSVADDKFPCCTGTATDRLRKLNERTRAAGWRGAGVWIACQAQGDGKDGRMLEGKALEDYWRERVRWSRHAGIEYWKVDYGARGPELRRLISHIAAEEAPELVIEHGKGVGPLNDEESWDPSWTMHGTGGYRAWDEGRVLAEAVELLQFSHVLRTYDVTAQLSIPTTLDRVAQILADAPADTNPEAILNAEDEVYLGAALGCALGVLRHPMWGELPGRAYDPFQVKHRTDEVVRAVRWQRIAPGMGIGAAPVRLSERRLKDAWTFREGDSWAPRVIGREVFQTAPAIVARGMPLPKVEAEGEPPYVVASRHPGGATAVAALARVSTERGIYRPRADVTVELADTAAPLGIFGHFRSLTLKLASKAGDVRLWAQDLAGDRALDVSDRVEQRGDRIRLEGALIDEIGLSAATAGDVSDPGMVLVIEPGPR